MTRINLLGQTRQTKPAFTLLNASHRVPVGAFMIVLATVGGIGWWYWSLGQTSARIDAETATARQQLERLKPVIAEVAAIEQRRTARQQRVAVIEQLRGGQQVPVQILDAISRSVPDLLWLTQLDQTQGQMTIEGRSSTLIALSDFVGNLGASGLIIKPVEIVSSQVETVTAAANGGASTDLIKFTVKAQLVQPAAPPAAPTAAKGGAR